MSMEIYILLAGILGAGILYGIWRLWKRSHANYQAIYVCLDGHLVRSRGEWMIDAALQYLGIAHEYEPHLQIDGRLIHPDFGLGSGIYLEYWGLNTKSYRKSKDLKKEHFARGNIKLISVENIDLKNLLFALEQKLRPFHLIT